MRVKTADRLTAVVVLLLFAVMGLSVVSAMCGGMGNKPDAEEVPPTTTQEMTTTTASTTTTARKTTTTARPKATAKTATKTTVVQIAANQNQQSGNRSLGVFTITAYCPCSKCCGQYANGITSTGVKAQAGRTIAVDPNKIPYGTRVSINGHVYVAEDCGGAIKGNRIDIFLTRTKRR